MLAVSVQSEQKGDNNNASNEQSEARGTTHQASSIEPAWSQISIAATWAGECGKQLLAVEGVRRKWWWQTGRHVASCVILGLQTTRALSLQAQASCRHGDKEDSERKTETEANFSLLATSSQTSVSGQRAKKCRSSILRPNGRSSLKPSASCSLPAC